MIKYFLPVVVEDVARKAFFNPYAVEATLSNISTMLEGNAPIGVDNKKVKLRPLTDSNTSGLALVTDTFDKQNPNKLTTTNPDENAEIDEKLQSDVEKVFKAIGKLVQKSIYVK